MATATATFGMTIRAARLGYHALAGIGFVRIQAGGPPHRVDIAPFDHVPTTKGKGEKREAVVWWEGDTALVERTIRRHVNGEVCRLTTLMLDDNGSVLPLE